MAIHVTLKNYRRFVDSAPASFIIGDGLTSFVGPNNSGKSTLLRFFWEFRDLFATLAGRGPWRELAAGAQIGVSASGRVADPKEVFHRENERPIEIGFEFDHLTNENTSGVPSLTKINLRMSLNWNYIATLPELVLPGSPWKPEDLGLRGYELMVQGSPVASVESMAHEFDLLAGSMYIGSFRNVINVGGREQYLDIQTGTGFVEAWKNYQGSGSSSSNIEASDRVVENIRTIFNLDHLQIYPSSDENTLQTLVNHRSFKLEELGSGMSQFILALTNAAMQHPTYVFIDEPELGLHPSLQLDFLMTLASYAQHGVIFATHSYGLARSGAEHVYAVTQMDANSSEVRPIESVPRMAEFLGEMNFSSYREMGFDKVLLVEGSTDVKTVLQFLRKAGKDHQIVMLPLGGSGMINANVATQLDEIKRITSNIAVLIDSERTRRNANLKPDRAAFVTLCEKAGFDVHVLELRAIENYFSARAVKAALGDAFSALKPFELLKNAANSRSKANNWKVALEMHADEIDETDLGKFIHSL